ncbi:hypothetical protein [Sphingomonas sp. SAFR-052]|uniref:hypothetical protein n=1 Tax=Sphingomonas sp. SAFR-052 TaxID=3436867 RepID=UPI003F7D6AAB
MVGDRTQISTLCLITIMDRAAVRLQETPMDLSREFLAYAIIGVVALIVIPWAIIAYRRRQRRRLRQRGIKRYGH